MKGRSDGSDGGGGGVAAHGANGSAIIRQNEKKENQIEDKPEVHLLVQQVRSVRSVTDHLVSVHSRIGADVDPRWQWFKWSFELSTRKGGRSKKQTSK